jgi:CheY-like chemotaxis protein
LEQLTLQRTLLKKNNMRHRTIIVDDDEDDRLALQKALHQNNVSSIGVFDNPVAVFEYLKKAEVLPLLIITDYNMPAVSGEELLAKIKAEKRLKNIAIVVMSSDKPAKQVDRCLQLGAVAWYRKPCSEEDANALVRQLLSVANC